MKQSSNPMSVVLSPLHKANRQVQLYLDDALKEGGFASGEVHMLAYIVRYGPCPIKELCRVFGQKPSTLTGILDRFEERNVVTRVAHPDDRRSVLIQGAEGAQELIEPCGAIVRAVEQAVCSAVTAEQLAGFYAVLAAIDSVTHVNVRELPTDP